MIFHEVEQNTPEWLALRLGRVCSSEFHKVMTPKKRQLSSSAPAYMYRLLAEWISGEAVENEQTEFMQRGHDLEDQAVRGYEGLTNTETQRGGFWTTDDGMIGTSPDRLIGDDGILEIKAPLLHTQVAYCLGAGVDDDYRVQLQGQMLVTGRKYVDVFSYHPRLIVPAIRVPRDEEYIGELRAILESFVGVMLDARAKLEAAHGPFVRPEPEEPDHSRDWITDEDVEILTRGRA